MFYLACQDVLQVLPMPLTWNSWQQFVHIARETFAFRLQSGTFAAYAAAATRVHGPDWQAHTIANPNFAPFWHTLLHHFALADPPGTAQQRAVILSVLALLPPFRTMHGKAYSSRPFDVNAIPYHACPPATLLV